LFLKISSRDLISQKLFWLWNNMIFANKFLIIASTVKSSFARRISNFHPIGVFIIGVSLLGSGCTFGNYGSLVTRYTQTETATIMDVYSVGLQMRTDQLDRGATLGYRRASYIYIRDSNIDSSKDKNCWLSFNSEGVEPSTKTEWCLFQSPTLDAEMRTRASTSAGIELQYTKELQRVNMGYLDQAITVGPKPNESIVYKLDYIRNEPEKTKLFFKRFK
jgi:hypothetical protein